MSKNKPLLIIFIGLMSIIGFILSLNFPDLDIRIFGIGMHRFFLFHSAIIPLLLFILAKLIFKLKDYLEVMIIAFCGSFSLGIGIHLFFDVFQSKAIMFPFIGSLIDDTSLDDRIWLIINILICFLFSFILYKRIVKLIGLKKVIVEPQTTFADLGVESNKEKKRHSVFELYKDSRGEYRFRLKAPNGEVILSSEGYTSKNGCMNGIKAVKRYSQVAVIVKD